MKREEREKIEKNRRDTNKALIITPSIPSEIFQQDKFNDTKKCHQR
jgi:hypothetical protein